MSRAAAALSSRRVRVLGFHDVRDPRAFADQLDWIGTHYRTVTAQAVADSLHGGEALPPSAVWITFDDGDRSVVRQALPLLRERGMTATAFVCGGWIDSDEVPWWHTLEAASAAGLLELEDVGTADEVQARLRLKRLDDTARRQVVGELAARLDACGARPPSRQWDAADLAAWLAAGNDVGNHSWDHPVLDTCDADQQRWQVRRAHDRLTALTGSAPTVWAWPNGDAAPAASDELRSLGYRLVVSYDHRLMRRRADPSAVSRLRLDAGADISRTRAIVSGAHSGVFGIARHLRRRGSGASSAG